MIIIMIIKIIIMMIMILKLIILIGHQGSQVEPANKSIQGVK